MHAKEGDGFMAELEGLAKTPVAAFGEEEGRKDEGSKTAAEQGGLGALEQLSDDELREVVDKAGKILAVRHNSAGLSNAGAIRS